MSARRGPLADSYLGAVALVICALVPFLMLTGALFPLLPVVSRDLGLSKSALEITIGLSDGAYAFGTVLAVQFAVHLPARRLLLGYVSAFLLAAVLAAWAPTGTVFLVALVVEGLCTSLMLIAAAPALVTGWPVKKMPATGFVMNMCVFGAVAAGPTIGASQLQAGGPSPASLAPLTTGVAMLAVLIVHQNRARHPLIRKPRWRSASAFADAQCLPTRSQARSCRCASWPRRSRPTAS